MKPSSSLRRLRQLTAKKRAKQIIIVAVLLLTALLFVRYFAQHPEYWDNLRQTSPWLIVAVIGMNLSLLVTLVFIYDAILRLCGKDLPWKERFMLTSYSSIVNFFGPLQSGPGVRAAYLKTKHQVRLRDYALGTLLYYGIFATISALFLLVGTRPWWQTLLVFIAVVGVSYLIIRTFQRRDKQSAASQFRIRPNVLAALIVATFMQVLLVSITYYIELHTLNQHITYGQAASYTGAANFALFVSLTPGAIGFREAFLVFSQHLHHVSTANILSANLVDRTAYVIFLLLLFLLMLGMHAGDKLQLTKLRRQAAAPEDER